MLTWHIQEVRGSRWGPLYGYGIVAEAAHLSTFCVKTTNGTLPAGDFEVVTQYYNANNNGFGFIAAQDMSKLGLNRYDKWSGAGVGYLPEQIGSYNLTPGGQERRLPQPCRQVHYTRLCRAGRTLPHLRSGAGQS